MRFFDLQDLSFMFLALHAHILNILIIPQIKFILQSLIYVILFSVQWKFQALLTGAPWISAVLAKGGEKNQEESLTYEICDKSVYRNLMKRCEMPGETNSNG